MKLKLKDIAILQSGKYFKPSTDILEDKAYVLGIRDFDEDLEHIGTALEIDGKDVLEKYILTENDVLFSSRMQFNAFYLPADLSKTYVASSSFILIKPDLNRVLPEYLIWLLNHPNTQNIFSSLSQATGRVSYISAKKLEEIELELPDLATQKQIVAVHRLQRKERRITRKLLEKKEQYIQHILFNTSKQ